MQNQFSNQMYGGANGNAANQGQGYNTLREYGTNPQQIRDQMQSQGNNNQGYMNGMGQSGYGNMSESVMHAGATNPQVVRQHIMQDTQSAPYAQYGMQSGYSSPMHAGASNPQMVQQHIAQDLHPNQMQSGYGMSPQQGVVHQVMQSVPAQVTGGYGQQLGYGSQYQGQGQGQNQGGQGYSTFSQYGTDPQQVQQHIQNDLRSNVGAMSSRQAGAYQGQGQGQSQMPYQNQNQYTSQGPNQFSGGQMQQNPMGQFSQYGTDPQTVRQHIQQDLSNYQ